MSADPSEGRERARQEFEKWAKSWYLGKRNYAGEMCDGSWVYRAEAIQHAWAGWNGRGRSLEQERWISVEERLPEPGHIVLAYCNDKIIDTAWLTDEEKQNWYLERTSPQDEPITYPVRDGYVTHWHELPAPPVPKGDS